MHGQLVLVAGLPGSGKTTYLCQKCCDGWLVFDDFKAQAFKDCPQFRSSRKLRALISALQDGISCVAADINFCKTESRQEAEQVLLARIPGLVPRWVFFENDPEACKANIRRRPGRAEEVRQRELGYVDEYSPGYTVPLGAEVCRVWREHAN